MADAKTLMDAKIVVATPEKLDFALRQDPHVLDDVGLIVLDEGHMIGLGSREIRYEVLIQRLLRRGDANQRRIVCLSAMFNPEDPYFKDFGNWLRNDEPGEFVHVQWRPTRQRFATLDWNVGSGAGRLAFIDGERPFVPRFVESSPPQKKRKNAFPQNDKEFCICAADAFARDGHTVLVYSPVRSQVEPLADEFRHMSDQGYLANVKKPRADRLAVAQAIRSGLIINWPSHVDALTAATRYSPFRRRIGARRGKKSSDPSSHIKKSTSAPRLCSLSRADILRALLSLDSFTSSL